MGCNICLTTDESLDLEKKYEFIGLYRFINKAGECYINSILQILFHNDLILKTFNSINKTHVNKEQNGGNLIFAVQNLLIEIKNHESLLDPIGIKNAMILINEDYKNNSADANDFICDFINELTMEIPKKDKYTIDLPSEEIASLALKKLIKRFYNRNNSIFIDLFYGNSFIEYYCQKNNHLIDIKFNNFITIDLSIYSFIARNSVNIEEILDDNFSLKKQDNTKICKICQEEIPFSERIYIYNLPKILILYINRNINDHFYNNKIEFNEELNMKKYIKNEKIFNTKYKLFGIIQNINGHFNAATINNYDKKWYFFNDEKEPLLLNNDIYKFNPVFIFYYLLE